MSSCLITAGATRNPIDAIRFITAHASGQTGIAVAGALAGGAVPVHLLGSREALLRQQLKEATTPTATTPVSVEEYGSTRDLMARMKAWVQATPGGAVMHSAAVGDYEAPARASKIGSGAAELSIQLRPTPKILDHLRGWGLTGPLVSFKAASPETTDEELIQIARAQLYRSGSDLVFANIIGRITAGVYLVEAHSQRAFDRRSDAIAALVAWLQVRLA